MCVDRVRGLCEISERKAREMLAVFTARRGTHLKSTDSNSASLLTSTIVGRLFSGFSSLPFCGGRNPHSSIRAPCAATARLRAGPATVHRFRESTGRADGAKQSATERQMASAPATTRNFLLIISNITLKFLFAQILGKAQGWQVRLGQAGTCSRDRRLPALAMSPPLQGTRTMLGMLTGMR